MKAILKAASSKQTSIAESFVFPTSCDNAPENCFFQMSSYSRPYVPKIYNKKNGEFA